MFKTMFALLLFLFPLAYSPGPGNLFFAANGARFGFKATIPANFGYHVATWIVTVAIGFGFGAAIERFPHVFSVLKIAGSAYMLWIAWNMLRSDMLTQTQDAKPATFGDGAMLLVLNPKAYVIIALMFTQFLAPNGAGQFVSVILIATVFTLNNLLAFLIWTIAGDAAGSLFRSPASARVLNVCFALCLAAVAVWMALA